MESHCAKSTAQAKSFKSIEDISQNNAKNDLLNN